MLIEENHQKVHHYLLIIGISLIIVNLIFLDFYLWLNYKKEILISPSITTQNNLVDIPKAVAQLSDEKIRQICQQEVDKAIATLSAVTTNLPAKTVYQTASYKQPSIVYIPLGGNISTTNQSWVFLGGAEAYFNKADYSGAKKISWEAFLKIKDSNGEANARLYDATHQVVISNSEINGGGDSYSLKSSLPLNLLDGSNLYQVQLRTSTGYEAYLEGARIKVEY